MPPVLPKETGKKPREESHGGAARSSDTRAKATPAAPVAPKGQSGTPDGRKVIKKGAARPHRWAKAKEGGAAKAGVDVEPPSATPEMEWAAGDAKAVTVVPEGAQDSGLYRCGECDAAVDKLSACDICKKSGGGLYQHPAFCDVCMEKHMNCLLYTSPSPRD